MEAWLVIRLPFVGFDVVYHVGKLDNNREASYEGPALSVSRCPNKWAGYRTMDPYASHRTVWTIQVTGARFLDETSLDPDARALILRWAQAEGVIEPCVCPRLTSVFQDGTVWYEHVASREQSKHRYNDLVVRRIVTSVPTFRLTDEFRAPGPFLRVVGWLAEWSAITVFAQVHGFDGAWQRYYGMRDDVVHPHGCLFCPEAWPMSSSSLLESHVGSEPGLPSYINFRGSEEQRAE